MLLDYGGNAKAGVNRVFHVVDLDLGPVGLHATKERADFFLVHMCVMRGIEQDVMAPRESLH